MLLKYKDNRCSPQTTTVQELNKQNSPFQFYESPEKNLKNPVFKPTIFSRCILIYDIYEL